MLRKWLQGSVLHVGQALREPEEFALRWHRGEVQYGLSVWAGLIFTSILGTTTYGMTMGILSGPGEVILCGLRCTAAAGLAWSISLPALYILNSLAGSKLSASTTLLAAVTTTSWGGLAMMASIPINWFFSVAIPEPVFLKLENLVVFTGVGVAMVDVFVRIMRSLEPDRPRAAVWWLFLVGIIGSEFFYALGLFNFQSRLGA